MVSQNPDGSFTVTLADVYAEVRKCQDAIATMQPQGHTLDDHEGRIRSLERWKYTVPASIVTAVAAIVTAVAEHK